MIEVEKKFNLTVEEKQRLLEHAIFVSEKKFTDVYYDTATFDLMKKNRWLRARDGKFNIKLPIEPSSKSAMDLYDEVEDEQKIRECLKLPLEGEMDDVLLLTGYGEVLSFQTVRQTYKEDEFRIDIDEACYSDGHTYRLAEIELLAETPDAAEHAVRAIVEFAQKKKLTFKPVHGKLLHYLSFKNPDVYNQILQSAFPDARRDIK